MNRSKQDLIRRLEFVEPTSTFRSHFSYENMGYVIVSEVIAKIAGMSWRQYCSEKIFKHLGMNRTSISNNDLVDENKACAHLLPALRTPPLPLWDDWEEVEAAAGIVSCAKDMELWLKYCLSAPPSLTATQQAQIVFEPEGFLEPLRVPVWSIYSHGEPVTYYGLGWMTYSLNGRQIFFHTGLRLGMQSILAVIPEEQLGIVILTNESPHLGAASLLNQLLDHYLSLPEIDWHQKSKEVLDTISLAIDVKKKQMHTERHINKQASLSLEDYEGEYISEAYGSIIVRQMEEILTIKLMGDDFGKLEHWEGDQFEIQGAMSGPPIPWVIEFIVEPTQQHPTGLTMPNHGLFVRNCSLNASN